MDNPRSERAPRPGAEARRHIRSCRACRQRKVKCDRQQPCANCARAKADCVYPPGPGRAPKRPRRVVDMQLQDRLSRLETLVRRLEGQDGKSSPEEDGHQTAKSTTTDSDVSTPSQSIERQFGRLLIDEEKSYYVSNVLWATLGDEVEELRDLLHDSASEDEGLAAPAEASVPESNAHLGSNAALMGFRALSHSLRAYHPSLSQSVTLFEFFKENVAPLVRIFHMSTMAQTFRAAIASVDTLDRNSEALLFAIYYSAVISISSEQCLDILGVSRANALDTYRFATEQAMARANLLNTQSMVLLQAAVLFLSALRNEDDTRTVWSLTSLVFHIAQAMGLHRDGASFRLRPFETELRRRLWWHICLLDIRSSECHGCEPIVRESAFDTKLPLNINDSDLSRDMVEPPAERQETTEMTFCLIRCEAMRTVWKICYVRPSMRPPHDNRTAIGRSGISPEESQGLADDLRRRLDERYLQYCDTSIPLFLASSNIARLIIARIWLIAHYPRTQKDYGTEPPPDLQDRLFLTSVEVLELCSSLLTNTDFEKWFWYLKTHVQWHAMAFVLSEICSRPPSPLCNRAYGYVRAVYDRLIVEDNNGRGDNPWRPIKRLMAKAECVREMQKTNRNGHHQKEADVSAATVDTDTSHQGHLSTSTHSASGSAQTTANPYAEAQGSNDNDNAALPNVQNALSMESLDPFMGMFPNTPGLEQFPDSASLDLFGATLAEDEFAQLPSYGMMDWAITPPDKEPVPGGFYAP